MNEAISSAMALLIPITAVAASFAALIVWIVAASRRRLHAIDSRHRERMAAIDKGVDLPPDPLPQPEQMPSRSRYLLRGLIWLGVGLAITFGMHGVLHLPPINGVGWIPVAVGAAYLIFYLAEGLRESRQKRQESASGGDQTQTP
jgi:membrane protein implicated in regulation of membrane protease activity